jgi:hypothetical protein
MAARTRDPAKDSKKEIKTQADSNWNILEPTDDSQAKKYRGHPSA